MMSVNAVCVVLIRRGARRHCAAAPLGQRGPLSARLYMAGALAPQPDRPPNGRQECRYHPVFANRDFNYTISTLTIKLIVKNNGTKS